MKTRRLYVLAVALLALTACTRGGAYAEGRATSEPPAAEESSAEITHAEASPEPETSMFTAVRDSCGLPAAAVQDGGATLLLDGRGSDDRADDTSKAELSAIACALGAIGTPKAIAAQIEQTRAMDGRQTAEHDGYSYSWTYHPDTGLDMILTDSRSAG